MERCFQVGSISHQEGHVSNRPMLLPWPPHAPATNSSFTDADATAAAAAAYRYSCQVVVQGGGIESSTEARAAAASKTHSEAERRRRERINGHLSTLRRLIPSANKLDKATLLGRVIEHVRDLKRKTIEIGKGITIPAEMDEVTVEYDEGTSHNKKDRYIMRASLCCEDHPGLYADLAKTLHGLKLRTIRADIATLGGRVRNVLILSTREGEDSNISPSTLKDSLRAVLNGVVFSKVSCPNSNPTKRQRVMPSFFFS